MELSGNRTQRRILIFVEYQFADKDHRRNVSDDQKSLERLMRALYGDA
jgi:hypothetical protein